MESMKDKLNMEKQMAMEFVITAMEIDMMDNGKIIYCKY
jgi:hypothetical protein